MFRQAIRHATNTCCILIHTSILSAGPLPQHPQHPLASHSPTPAHRVSALATFAGVYGPLRALEGLAAHTPQLPAAQLLHARALYALGHLDEAQRKAAGVLHNCPEDIFTQLLVCSIYVRQGKSAEAMAALDHAVSANFGVRDVPLYHIVRARVLRSQGNVQDARKVSPGVELRRGCCLMEACWMMGNVLAAGVGWSCWPMGMDIM